MKREEEKRRAQLVEKRITRMRDLPMLRSLQSQLFVSTDKLIENLYFYYLKLTDIFWWMEVYLGVDTDKLRMMRNIIMMNCVNGRYIIYR